MDTATIGQQFAKAVAEHIARHMFPPHRGVIEVRNPFGGQPLIVAFGNDGYTQDERTRRYTDALVHELAEPGAWDVEFGTDDEGYTWALVVRLDHNDDPATMRQLIEDAMYARYIGSRGGDCGFIGLRKSICDREIIEHTGGEPLRIDGWESIN
jgi:hypothetical protein